jgi:hypothetical protein
MAQQIDQGFLHEATRTIKGWQCGWLLNRWLKRFNRMTDGWFG